VKTKKLIIIKIWKETELHCWAFPSNCRRSKRHN